MRTLLLLFASLTLAAAPTIYRVPGDYAATQAGLQAAVDACRSLNSTDPCIVEGAAGTTVTMTSLQLKLRGDCTGVNTPDTGCTGAAAHKRIIIRSSNVAAISGRATPAQAPSMFKISKTWSGNCVIESMPGAATLTTPRDYSLIGLDIEDVSVNGANYGGIVCIGFESDAGNRLPTNFTQFPSNIHIDKCYMHGFPVSTWVTGTHGTHFVAFGVRPFGRNVSVTNSYITDINMWSTDRGHGETVGIGGTQIQGGLYLYNNYVDAAIGILTGGEYVHTPGMIPTGYYAFANEVTRNATSTVWIEWNAPTLTLADPCLTGSYLDQRFDTSPKYDCTAGTWTLNSSPTRTKANWVKNGIECKNCRIAVWEGNYVHDIADTGDQSQHGYAFLINHVDADTGNANTPWARPEYIRVENNLVRRTGAGLAMGGNFGSPFRPISNVLIRNNIMENMMSTETNPLGRDNPGGTQFALAGTVIAVEKNTVMSNRTNQGTFTTWSYSTSDGAASADVVHRDNIGPWSSIAFKADGPQFGEGCAQIGPNVTGTFVWNNWALVDVGSNGAGLYGTYYDNGNAYCATTKTRLAAWSNAGFVNYNNGSGGDYRICTAAGVPHASCSGASTLATMASDGGPLGADADLVTWATTGVSTGAPDAKWYEFQIRRLEESGIRYTSYGTAACTWTIKTLAGGAVQNGTDAGGDRDRLITPTALAAGEYRFRVTCDGGRYRDETFKAH